MNLCGLNLRSVSMMLFMLAYLLPDSAFAQVIPAADVSKATKNLREESEIKEREEDVLPASFGDVRKEEMQLPGQFSEIKIKLNEMKIIGSTVYDKKQLLEICAPYLGKEISLDKIWVIASEITKKYNQDGYFLSKAYVPEQEFDVKADVTIKVYEGGIGKVRISDKLMERSYIRNLVREIESQKPLNVKYLEEKMLRLNDIPGVKLKGVLQRSQDEAINQSELVMVEEKVSSSSMVKLDNHGSRFLGPQRATFSHTGVYIPYVKTSFALLSSVPTDELKSIFVSNQIPITSEIMMDVFGSYTDAEPGSTIKPQEIVSNSKSFGVDIIKKVIRQRKFNLDVKVGYESIDAKTNVFVNSPLSRDHIRSAKFGVNVSDEEFLSGSTNLELLVKQGLDVFGASEKNDVNSSRTATQPDFLKFELKSNYQTAFLKNKVGMNLRFNAQYSDDSLQSSEEFGYGGSTLGKAYDESELSGDSGIAGGIEINYLALTPLHGISNIPYAYYDAGKVWNNNPGQVKQNAAASYGAGLRSYYKGLNANIDISAPAGEEIINPIYGDEDSFRLGFSVIYNY